MRWSVITVSLCLLLVAPGAAKEDSGAPTGGVATLSEGAAILLALEIAPRIEEIRGLRFKRIVPVEVVNDATAREHFMRRVAKFWPEERIRAEQTIYTHLGILPEGTNLLAMLFDILEEQAGGYYDPESGSLFILDDMPLSTAPILMAHELTHALDDQHFDIDRLIDGASRGNDRETAVGAVIEGSGTLIMNAYLKSEALAGRLPAHAIQDLQESEAGRAEKLKAAPQFIQRSLVGSYVLGQAFLLHGNASSASDGSRQRDLDRAFRTPPSSTEQILHPEKYWDNDSRDLPREVDIPDLSPVLGDDWSLRASGILGEMILAIVVGADPIDVTAAGVGQWTNEAAAGWGGDRWHLYGDGDRSASLLVTVWDTEKDAEEFEAAFPPSPRRMVVRRGDAVVIVAGDPGDQGHTLAERALKAVDPGDRSSESSSLARRNPAR